MWISLIVCNFAILASNFLRIIGRCSKTNMIYSSRVRRLGVPLQPSTVSSFQVRTGFTGEEGSGGIELSKLDVTVDLEFGDVPTMARTKSRLPSPPPAAMFDHQQVDAAV
jgi:hypothetical protein